MADETPMKQVPLEEGYFRLPSGESGDRGALFGSYSKAADKYFFPRRFQCPITETPVEDVELPSTGELYSWTYIEMPMMGSMNLGGKGGYGVGQVDLPCGVRVQAPLRGKQGDWKIGMPMVLDFEPAKKKGKTEYLTFCFKSAEE